MRNRDKPASPLDNRRLQVGRNIKDKVNADGLTKREVAAMHNMAALITKAVGGGKLDEEALKTAAQGAVKGADILFDELDGD